MITTEQRLKNLGLATCKVPPTAQSDIP